LRASLHDPDQHFHRCVAAGPALIMVREMGENREFATEARGAP